MPTSNPDRPRWLRQRKIGHTNTTNINTSNDMMQRLQHEATLEGHAGCVNCLEWNQRGNLLASGSDDHKVIVWDAFRRTKKNVIESGHSGTIFSVKFVPDNTDSLVATCASDSSVRLTEIATGKNMLTCALCHSDRVKRLATHPSQPNLLWSAGEDGYILQFDLRQRHECNNSRPTNLLIDLKTGPHVMAKCIATNPMRDEMLAVGSNDIYNRLYDRRYLTKESGRNSCTTYFVPGHLVNSNNRSNHLQSFGTTYLAFSPDGSELLASVHAEQVYLFNVYEPWERYKSFETSLKPLLLDKQPPTGTISSKMLPYKPYLHWYDLKKRHTPQHIPEQYRSFYDQAEARTFDELKLPKKVFDQLNELILKFENCPEFYRLRAEALMNRGWRGDDYQALRDCSSALALNPLDTRTLGRLAVAVCRLGYKDAAIGLLEILDLMSKEIHGDNYLTSGMNLLREFRKQSDHHHGRSTFANDKFEEDMFNADHDGLATRTSPEFLMQFMAGVELSLGDVDFLTKNGHKESNLSSNAFDYSKRFCGHCNMNTDIKEASFFGSNGEFIVGGSDDGAFYIWDKASTNIVKAVSGDNQILNCVQPHPNICLLATSGIETSVKLWSSLGHISRDVDSIETRCLQNQEYISIDPLEAMVMMLYPDR